jgi:hypothetical protein
MSPNLVCQFLYIFCVIITIYRVRINYRRISLRHNLSKKCRKIVKFVSITHSERNIWNGPIVATAISRKKNVNQCWRKMAASTTERSWCVLEFCGFNARSDGNLDVVVLLRRRSEGGINNFVTEERVVRGGHVLPKRRSTECVKLSLATPGNLYRESVYGWRHRSPQWGKFYGNDCSCTRTNCNWYKIIRSSILTLYLLHTMCSRMYKYNYTYLSQFT